MIQKLKVRRFANYPGGIELKIRLNAAIAKLPKMAVFEETHHDGLGGWFWKNGWVGAHFTMLFYHVMTSAFSWFQGLLVQKTTRINTGDGQLEVSGLIVTMHCVDDNRTLMLITNEPGAPMQLNEHGEEIHPILRHPIQGGVEKWERVVNGGETKLDPVLAKVLERMGKNALEALEWQQALSDTTRMKGLTLISHLFLPTSVFEELVTLTGGLTFTLRELEILLNVGELMPPHTVMGLA